MPNKHKLGIYKTVKRAMLDESESWFLRKMMNIYWTDKT